MPTDKLKPNKLWSEMTPKEQRAAVRRVRQTIASIAPALMAMGGIDDPKAVREALRSHNLPTPESN